MAYCRTPESIDIDTKKIPVVLWDFFRRFSRCETEEEQVKTLKALLSLKPELPKFLYLTEPVNDETVDKRCECLSALMQWLPLNCLPTMFEWISDNPQLFAKRWYVQSRLNTARYRHDQAIAEGLSKRTVGENKVSECITTLTSNVDISADNLTTLIICALLNKKIYERDFDRLIELLQDKEINKLDLSRLVNNYQSLLSNSDWDNRVIPGLKRILAVLAKNHLSSSQQAPGSENTNLLSKLSAQVEPGSYNRSSLWVNKDETVNMSIRNQYAGLERSMLGINIPVSRQELLSCYAASAGTSFTATIFSLFNVSGRRMSTTIRNRARASRSDSTRASLITRKIWMFQL